MASFGRYLKFAAKQGRGHVAFLDSRDRTLIAGDVLTSYGAVVSTAAAMADAEGLPAVSPARLAGALGIRAPSLYAHVAGLDDLRRRLRVRAARELAAAIQVAGRAGADALQALAHAYRAYARAHPGLYAALQRTPDPGDDEEAGQLVGVVLAVLRGYGLERDDAIHGARVVRAALHGFVTLETGEGFGYPLSLDESFKRLIAVIDCGLGTAGSPSGTR